MPCPVGVSGRAASFLVAKGVDQLLGARDLGLPLSGVEELPPDNKNNIVCYDRLQDMLQTML